MFVEGTDDERFFETVIMPQLEKKYDWVSLQRYAQTSSKKTKSFIANLPNIGADYIIVADMDECPCITVRKQKTREKLPLVEADHVIVVTKEIESWYLAGLDTAECQALGLPQMSSTEAVFKEDFDSLMPDRFDSRIDFMVEVLKRFSPEVAKSKNASFKYLLEKYCG